MKARLLLALIVLSLACTHLFGQDSKASPPSQSGNVDLLFDTKGVDFEPYLAATIHDIKINWYARLPKKVYPPELKRAKLAIQFTIRRDGNITSMVLTAPSGDTELDRACWDAIRESSPFKKLPEKFPDAEIKLRFRFYYNPPKDEKY